MANNCEAFQELAAAAALGGLASLTAAERRTLAEHLSACGDCRSLYREMVETADRIPLTVSPIAPPVELRQRVLAAVAAEASASHPSRPARTAGARPATGKTAMAIRPLAAAAMVLALAAGGAWGAVTSVRQRAEAHALAALERAARQQLAVLEAVSGRERWQGEPHAVLVSTEHAPGAGGEAWLLPYETGRVLVLKAEGLPLLPAPRAYHAWLLTGTHRFDGGVFRPDADGRAVLAVEVEGPPAFDAVGVTLEPDPYGTSPRGPRVLAGRFEQAGRAAP